MMKKLPIGVQHLPKFQQNNYIYVDKTTLIHQLITSTEICFLSRPRRFGKSLLDSTMKEIFLGNRALFKGLWIEDQWDLAHNQYEKDARRNERFYHSIIHWMFKYLGVHVQSEVRSAQGRSNSVVQTPTHVYIFEFKFNKSGREVLSQIIEKGYADPYRASGKTILGIGVSFSGNKKAINGWAVEELSG
jgi:Predicted AAA-ATPase/PD-(D/E)XK nuclease superfamily